MRTPELITVDKYGIRRLSNLPRLNSASLINCLKEQVSCLLEREAQMSLSEEQELAHPSHQVRPMLGQRQLPILQEVGVTIQDGSKL